MLPVMAQMLSLTGVADYEENFDKVDSPIKSHYSEVERL